MLGDLRPIFHVKAFVLHIWTQHLDAHYFAGDFVGAPLILKFAFSDS